MDVTLADLEQTYAGKTDEELLQLHGTGMLSEQGYGALERELAMRRMPVPMRPAGEAVRETMVPRQRNALFEQLAVKATVCLPIAVIAPPIQAYGNAAWLFAALPLLLGPMALLVRGARALFSQERLPAHARTALLGGATAAVCLLLAPWSISAALHTLSTRPSGLAWAIGGAAGCAAYLVLVYRRLPRP